VLAEPVAFHVSVMALPAGSAKPIAQPLTASGSQGTSTPGRETDASI